MATFKINFKLKEPENDSYLTKKNTKEIIIIITIIIIIIINHKGTRMVKDGED